MTIGERDENSEHIQEEYIWEDRGWIRWSILMEMSLDY